MSNNFNVTKEFFYHYEANSTSDDVQRYYVLWKSVIGQAMIDSYQFRLLNKQLSKMENEVILKLV